MVYTPIGIAYNRAYTFLYIRFWYTSKIKYIMEIAIRISRYATLNSLQRQYLLR